METLIVAVSCMWCPMEGDADSLVVNLPDGSGAMSLPRVTHLSALGFELSETWTDHHVLKANLQKAEKAWYRDQKYFRSREIPIMDRCRRYVSRVQSIVLYACEGMTMDEHTIERLYVWECKFLAILGGRRKGRNEDWT